MKIQFKSMRAAALVLPAMMFIAAVQIPAAYKKPVLSSGEIKSLVVSARTPAEHMTLANHYTALAVKHEADAREHEALAAEYSRVPQGNASKHPMAGNTAEHCRHFAEHCREAAKDLRAMAAAHEEMAKNAGK